MFCLCIFALFWRRAPPPKILGKEGKNAQNRKEFLTKEKGKENQKGKERKICGFSAYSWKLPAYSGAFLLTVDKFSFFTDNWSFFAYSFSFLTNSWSFFCLQWESATNKGLKAL